MMTLLILPPQALQNQDYLSKLKRMNSPEKKRPLPPLSKDGSIHVTDEVINTVTHMIGAMFSLLGTVLLITQAAQAGRVWQIVSFSIYGASLLMLFTASTFHHGLDIGNNGNALLRLFDYLAIFFLIAGTYTPLCLVLSRNLWGWSILGVVWTLTIIGVIVKAVFPRIPRWVTNTLYLGIGWVGVVLIFRTIPTIKLEGLLYLLVGGLFYTSGAVIYHSEKPNPVPGKFGFHEIWHLFVLAGAAIHYLFMYRIVLPFQG